MHKTNFLKVKWVKERAKWVSGKAKQVGLLSIKEKQNRQEKKANFVKAYLHAWS